MSVPNRPRENLCFLCTFNHYGCERTFATIAAWMRHVKAEHIRPGVYRCDVEGCTAYYYRGDKLLGHQHQVHRKWLNNKTVRDEVLRRCWHEVRKPPAQSSCPFCKQKFAGPDSWPNRMRHVGKHLANGEPVDQAVEDVQLREWAIDNGILVPGIGGWRLKNIVPRMGPKRVEPHEDLKKLGEKVPTDEEMTPCVRNGSLFYDSGIGTSLGSASSSSVHLSKDTPKRPLSPDTLLSDPRRRSSYLPCCGSTRPYNFQETGKADSRDPTRFQGDTTGGTTICSQIHAVLPPASFSEISSRNSLRREEYRIGWISALKVEFRAALQMLDQRHQPILGHSSDDNLYVQGRIGIHNVVLTCLPEGRYGTNFAAMVATRMMNTYPNIQIGFMVGIGGGLPSPQNDIRLGDVIVSRPEREHGGVVQYDMGKYTVDGFQRTGFLNAPPERLLAVLNIMPEHDEPLPRCRTATYPGAQLDRLFCPTYIHVTSNQTCIDCSETETLKRGPGNREAGPHVYYGTIASGNMVIKDAGARDLLVQKHGVLCFEMEAAGLMNTNFPCLVIRGVSDYADSHKNDVWKKYAAASAAEYARSLICAIPENMYSK